MFEGFWCKRIEENGATLFVRQASRWKAPQLVFLQGYPTISAIWHGLVPILARSYQIVCVDLREYGQSDRPALNTSHQPHLKTFYDQWRLRVMRYLGHERFLIDANDLGARVAHQMGLDHPDQVAAMTLHDIAPTREMYAISSVEFARAFWHWFFWQSQTRCPKNNWCRSWNRKCFKQANGKNPFFTKLWLNT